MTSFTDIVQRFFAMKLDFYLNGIGGVIDNVDVQRHQGPKGEKAHL